MNLEEEDLSREIFPLSHYVNNRKRLINEAFNVLKGPRLESTIPPALKGIDTSELKSLCLEELSKIDTLTIVDVIEGRVKPECPVANEDEPAKKMKSSDDRLLKPLASIKKKLKKSLKSIDDSEVKVEIKLTKPKKEKKRKSKKGSKKSDSPHVSSSNSSPVAKKKVKSKKTKKEKKSSKLKKNEETEKSGVPRATSQPGERTLMELLELEYRAKAIKALLKYQGFKGDKIDDVLEETSTNQTGAYQDSSLDCAPEKKQSETTIHSTLRTTASEQMVLVPTDNDVQSTNRTCKDDMVGHVTKEDYSDEVSSDSLLPEESDISMEQHDESANLETPITHDDANSYTCDITKAISSGDKHESDSKDDVVVTCVNSNADIPSEVDEVSEEEDGEIGSDYESENNKSERSTPPHLSPAYSDAGDFQVTLRHSPSPISERETGEQEKKDDESNGNNNTGDETAIIPTGDNKEAAFANPFEVGSGPLVENPPPDLPSPIDAKNNPDSLSEETADVINMLAISTQSEQDCDQDAQHTTGKDDDIDADAVNVYIPSEYPEEATPITWYERWYSSQKVQKVVTSTKMYGKVRKKLKVDKESRQSKSKLEKLPETSNPVEPSTSANDDNENVPIIGSIEEYEKLFGKKIISQNLDVPEALQPEVEQGNTADTELKTDDESEAEDDDLWGEIIGNS